MNKYKPEFGVQKGIDGEWQATFKIGVQTFILQENGDKEHALWFVEQLKEAFKNLGSETPHSSRSLREKQLSRNNRDRSDEEIEKMTEFVDWLVENNKLDSVSAGVIKKYIPKYNKH